jgi:hypothetical protein
VKQAEARAAVMQDFRNKPVSHPTTTTRDWLFLRPHLKARDIAVAHSPIRPRWFILQNRRYQLISSPVLVLGILGLPASREICFPVALAR